MEKRYINTGPADPMIGAFMEGANLRPKKKKVMFMVIPDTESKMSFVQSSLVIQKLLTAKGKRSREALKKRKNAKVKGVIF